MVVMMGNYWVGVMVVAMAEKLAVTKVAETAALLVASMAPQMAGS